MTADETGARTAFEESYWRAVTATVNGKSFADAFYDRFLATSDEVRHLFARTDFPVQKRMFLLSIVYISSLYAKDRPGHMVERLARRHRAVGVRPEMFGSWTDCLLETVREYDPECDAAVLDAWRVVLRPGLDYMMSMCST